MLSTIVLNFVVLTYFHFVIDWVFQSHDVAMRKVTEWQVRADHCLIYTVGMSLAAGLFLGHALSIWKCFAITGILFFSHFFEDTYKPVIWWFKHIRKHPAFQFSNPPAQVLKYVLADSPLNYILLIAIDQIIHITFLWPIAYLIVS